MLGVKFVVEGENGKAIAGKFGRIFLMVLTTVLVVFTIMKYGDQIKILLVNFAVALVGAFLAIELMIYAYRRLDKLTPFDTAKELESGNQAVGMIVGGLFIGIGLVIGLIMALGVS